jgi:hypothetical protein
LLHPVFYVDPTLLDRPFDRARAWIYPANEGPRTGVARALAWSVGVVGAVVDRFAVNVPAR